MWAHLFRGCLLCLLLVLVGCGGGGGPVPGNGGGNGPSSTTITATFPSNAVPNSVAVQTGTNPFVSVPVNSNVVTFTVPSGTTKYAIAVVFLNFEGPQNFEFIFAATLQDGTSIQPTCGLQCLSNSPVPTDSATGGFDASAIPGVSEVEISGRNGTGTNVNAASSSFNIKLATGINDVALTATPFGSFPVLAAKIVRNQTVPGAINGGNTITLGSADLITTQPLTVTNIAPGFSPPIISVSYFTANTGFPLSSNSTNSTQYPVVPAASAQTGDGYIFNLSTASPPPSSQINFTLSSTTAAGGPFTIAIPDPLTFSGPAPSAFPTFTFDYPPVAGFANVSRSAEINWLQGPGPIFTDFTIDIAATPSFLNGANTISIPNLSGLPGFIVPPSGTSVGWKASISGATAPGPNSTQIIATNHGSYTVP